MSHIEHDRNADLRPTRLGIHHASLPLGHHTEHAQHLTVAGSIEEDLNVSPRKLRTRPDSSLRVVMGQAGNPVQEMRTGFYITAGKTIFRGGEML